MPNDRDMYNLRSSKYTPQAPTNGCIGSDKEILQAKKVKKTDTPLSSEASDDTAVPDNIDSETEAPPPANPLAVDNFRISPEVKAVLKKKGIESRFDIQAQTLSHVLDGKDLLGRARWVCCKEVGRA